MVNTKTVNFLGARDEASGVFGKVQQGADFVAEIAFLDADDNPLDYSLYQSSTGGTVRGAFKSSDGATTYFSTEDSTLVLTWLDTYILRLRIPAADSSALTGPLPNTCIYQIEGIQGGSGYVDRLLQGRFEMDTEIVTATT